MSQEIDIDQRRTVHARAQLTSSKRPSEIILMNALPATSTGKILKHKLAESLRQPTSVS